MSLKISLSSSINGITDLTIRLVDSGLLLVGRLSPSLTNYYPLTTNVAVDLFGKEDSPLLQGEGLRERSICAIAP